MRWHVLLGAVGISLGLCGAQLRAADGPQRCVTFILDCSHSMGDELKSGDEVQPVSETAGTSRMTAAKQGLSSVLTDLAAAGNHHVGLWLYGHRLAWDDQPDPQLVEQTEYLEQTLNYNVLSTLLPGDDVEAIRAMTRFRPLDLAQVDARLAVVKPWGESPLYLAIVRSLDLFESQPASALHSIVVITDGGDHQGLANHTVGKTMMLEAAERRKVPVDVIWVGTNSESDSARSEINDVARLTGGSFATATSAAELTEKIRIALGRQTPASAGGVNAQTTSASDRSAAPLLTPVTLEGKISFYERPVTTATVTVEGLGTGPVKTDRSGRFTIRDVPPGTYQVSIRAIAKNRIRNKTIELKVIGDRNQEIVVELQ